MLMPLKNVGWILISLQKTDDNGCYYKQFKTTVRGAFPARTFISLKTFIRNSRIATQEELMTLKLNVINIKLNTTVRGVLTSINFRRKFSIMTLQANLEKNMTFFCHMHDDTRHRELKLVLYAQGNFYRNMIYRPT